MERLPFIGPAATERFPDSHLMVEAGREYVALELPLTSAAEARAETAWNSALN